MSGNRNLTTVTGLDKNNQVTASAPILEEIKKPSEPIYVNSWENVKNYLFFIYKSKGLDTKRKEELFATIEADHSLPTDHDKIKALYDAIAEQLPSTSGTTKKALVKIQKFITKQEQKSDAEHLTYFLIKNNSYSKIKRTIRNDFVARLTAPLNNNHLEPERKKEIINNHLNHTITNKVYVTQSPRFSSSIKSLSTKFSKSSHSMFQPRQQYETKINWHDVIATIDLALDNSSTDQKALKNKIKRKLTKIILSGAGDNAKITSIFNYLDVSITENNKKYNKKWQENTRLANSLIEIRDAYWTYNKIVETYSRKFPHLKQQNEQENQPVSLKKV